MSRGKLEEVSIGLSTGQKPEGGIVRGVKILGFDSSNKRRYPKAVVVKALPKYEGARVNIDHPSKDGESRSYASRFGSLSAVRMADNGMYGDLNYNPKHPLAPQFEYDVEHSPSSVGLSHVVFAEYNVGKDGILNVTEINRVASVDLVADPATTSSLFESESEDSEVATELTLEAVKADEGIMATLREELLAEQSTSDTAKKAATDHAALLKENEQLKAEASKAKRTATVDAAIKEAELPEAMTGGTFRAACLEADDAGLKTLITEQAAAFKKLTEEWEEKKPTSKGKSAGGADTSKLRDGKAFASQITE